MHVLVVDDEFAVRKSMTILLESLGHKVSGADGTEAALDIARTSNPKPDVALIDYRLRGQDSGLVTIDRLRELDPALPVTVSRMCLLPCLAQTPPLQSLYSCPRPSHNPHTHLMRRWIPALRYALLLPNRLMPRDASYVPLTSESPSQLIGLMP